MTAHMFPEYVPIRYHTPWEGFHDLEYYLPAEYPHPLMICPPTGSAFDDMVYSRRDFHSLEDSFYLSTESSPTSGAVVTPFNEMDNEDDSEEVKTHHTCKVHKKSAKHTDPDAKKARPKDKKRCHNCNTAKSPSWRRSVTLPHKGSLLCNACGL